MVTTTQACVRHMVPLSPLSCTLSAFLRPPLVVAGIQVGLPSCSCDMDGNNCPVQGAQGMMSVVQSRGQHDGCVADSMMGVWQRA